MELWDLDARRLLMTGTLQQIAAMTELADPEAPLAQAVMGMCDGMPFGCGATLNPPRGKIHVALVFADEPHKREILAHELAHALNGDLDVPARSRRRNACSRELAADVGSVRALQLLSPGMDEREASSRILSCLRSCEARGRASDRRKLAEGDDWDIQSPRSRCHPRSRRRAFERWMRRRKLP